MSPAKKPTPECLRESERVDLAPIVILWQGYGSLKLTSKRAKTLRWNGIGIEGLTLADGMYFSSARGPVKLASPSNNSSDG